MRSRGRAQIHTFYSSRLTVSTPVLHTDSQHTSFAYHPLEKKVGSDHARNLLSLVMQCGGYEKRARGTLLFWTFSARARARRAARGARGRVVPTDNFLCLELLSALEAPWQLRPADFNASRTPKYATSFSSPVCARPWMQQGRANRGLRKTPLFSQGG